MVYGFKPVDTNDILGYDSENEERLTNMIELDRIDDCLPPEERLRGHKAFVQIENTPAEI